MAKCWWCREPIKDASIGHCLVHVATGLTQCVPGHPESHHVLREELGQRTKNANTRNAIKMEPAEAHAAVKNDRWPDWRHWVAGKRASQLHVVYENGAQWIWYEDQGEYLVSDDKCTVVAPDGREWTCEGVERVKRKKRESTG